MKKLNTLTRTYSSGFEAQVIMRPHFLKQFMGIIVDFGGADPQKVAGGAHFLEHMLFKKKGGDIAHKFEEVGATTNAFTSENETMFYAEMTSHWRQVLPLLFELVGTTEFTEKNIAKESHIISQELSMYQDDALWELHDELFKRMYPNNNLSVDLAGTHASILTMTPENLQEIYDANYFAANMKFVACGGFSENQAKSILREVGKLEKEFLSSKKVKRNRIKSIETKLDHDLTIKDNIDTSRIMVGIKLPDFLEFDASRTLMQSVVESMLDENLGTMSHWFKFQQFSGTLASPLDISVSYTRQGNFATITGFTYNIDIVSEEIKKQITQAYGNEELFNLQKKEYMAEMIRERDSISDLAIDAAEMMLEGEKLSEVIRRFQNLSFNEFRMFYEKIIEKSDIFTAKLIPAEDSNNQNTVSNYDGNNG